MKILSFGSKSGTTLIELMIALIIIALIIIGGGMFFFYGRVNIIREAHRRAALLVASQRLEELKAAEYDKISPGFDDSYYIIWSDADNYYIIWSESKKDWIKWSETQEDWVSALYQPPLGAQEPVDVDNLLKTFTPHPTMVTEAKWMDDDGDYTDYSYDYLKITVTVSWHGSTSNTVGLSTLIAPH